MNVGLIGFGYWGQIYLKTLKNIPDINILVATHDYEDILDKVDCVIVATPANTHFSITKKCLEYNKYVLIEKPFTTNSEDANKIIELDNKKILLGHIYLHHNGILKIKQLIDEGYLGNIEYIHSKRMSTSKYPKCIWEIGIHDVYILQYFFNQIGKVSKVLGNEQHCIFNLKFKNINTYVECCSYYPGKIREMIIVGDDKKLIFNEQKDPKLYSIDKKQKMEVIEFDESVPALEKECKYFFQCVSKKENPSITLKEGIKVINILEKIEKYF